MNKVSIIVPVYNVEKYLKECIESIINQTYRDLEIILVDDGSTDGCPRICDQYEHQDNRIIVIHKKNGGLSDARNAGMAVMTGDHVLFVDSDDYVSVDMVDCMLQAALKHSADIVECDFIKTRLNGASSDVFQREKETTICHYSAEQALESLMQNELKQMVWNKLYTARSIEGLLFEVGRINEDEFWTYQVFGRVSRLVRIQRELYYYRQQPESIMGISYSIRRLDGLIALEERMEYMAKRFPSLLPLAKETFCFGGLFHYQMLLVHSGVDPDKEHRKKIVSRVKKAADPTFCAGLSLKNKCWLRLFCCLPDFTCRARNLFKIGL